MPIFFVFIERSSHYEIESWLEEIAKLERTIIIHARQKNRSFIHPV